MICLQSILGLNLNKVQVIDKTIFLTVCNQLLSIPSLSPVVVKALLQILCLIAGESYHLGKNICESEVSKEVVKLMMRTTDETIIRKCVRLLILISNTGQSISSVISPNEI